ncbi:electron transfer flavoprotein subunit alpha/FixB family protein [uncultured Ferrimonas sp.]|uniref:electron transfer flavoprotein subunit alpha/FixB family protein n=1 Tax=uncultured Ferrimonas sp. TaxID=432640 RepID=UPI00262A2A1D|nr:electron transfer flavoprotein subunit alpha/FixB family protein [uncultured Ferrimonas sp.]
MSAVLILHHHNQAQWPQLFGAVEQLSQPFDVIVCAPQPLVVVANAQAVMRLPVSDHDDPQAIARALLPHCQRHQQVLMAADPYGRELLPLLASMLDRPMVSEVTAIAGQQWQRPAWAGAIEQQFDGAGIECCLSVRASGFAATACRGDGSALPEQLLAAPAATALVRQVQPLASARPPLATASTVIAVGRGVATAEQWQLVEALADKLGAAIGGTRPVIDAGALPSELQIGQTGQLIAPQRYIGLGISGATQHMAGIKQAETVIAVNQDGAAPLMQLADFALVGDLQQILPELMEIL